MDGGTEKARECFEWNIKAKLQLSLRVWWVLHERKEQGSKTRRVRRREEGGSVGEISGVILEIQAQVLPWAPFCKWYSFYRLKEKTVKEISEKYQCRGSIFTSLENVMSAISNLTTHIPAVQVIFTFTTVSKREPRISDTNSLSNQI